MKRFSRKFDVSSADACEFMSRHRAYRNCVNSRKVGRNRRGTIRLAGCQCRNFPGDSFVVLSFESGSAFWEIGGSRFQRYGYADMQKLIRSLAIAERRYKMQSTE